jgi:hypothetical protein
VQHHLHKTFKIAVCGIRSLLVWRAPVRRDLRSVRMPVAPENPDALID